MAMVKCAVNGCGQRLQPVLKVDPRDRDTWFYPECELCGRPVCEKHSSEVEGRLVCDPCRREAESGGASVELIELGIAHLRGPRPGDVSPA